MGGWGRQNPWPFQWGGGESAYEQLWSGLRAMLGTNGAGPVGGLEDAWREAECAGLVAVATMAERAALQALPLWATDHLAAYEALLGVEQAATDHERRAAVSAAWVSDLSAVIPDLTAALTAIDSGISILVLDEDHTATSHLGRAFAPSAPPAFPTGLVGSQYPNYSTHFVLYLQWAGCPLGIPPQATRAEVEQLLNTALPAWVDYVITNDTALFYLDGFNNSRLDLTPLGS